MSNDVDAVSQKFSPDARVRVAGSAEASPIPCDCKGGVELQDLTKALVETWHFKDMSFRSITIQDNRAAVLFDLKAEFVPLAETVESEVLDLLTFENGMITEVVEFVDTAMVAQLAARVGNA